MRQPLEPLHLVLRRLLQSLPWVSAPLSGGRAKALALRRRGVYKGDAFLTTPLPMPRRAANASGAFYWLKPNQKVPLLRGVASTPTRSRDYKAASSPTWDEGGRRERPQNK